VKTGPGKGMGLGRILNGSWGILIGLAELAQKSTFLFESFPFLLISNFPFLFQINLKPKLTLKTKLIYQIKLITSHSIYKY